VGTALVYWFAKGLEILGLIFGALAIYVGIVAGDFRTEAWMATLAVVGFFTGVILERMSGTKPEKLKDGQ
jgi:hypothetical protein